MALFIIGISPDMSVGPSTQVIEASEAPLEMLQAIVGGDIQLVSGLDTIEVNGQTAPCEAYCNEEGKLHELPLNIPATIAWANAMAISPRRMPDFLVGTIAIVIDAQDVNLAHKESDPGNEQS